MNRKNVIMNYGVGDLNLPYCEYLNTSEPKMIIDGDIGGSGVDCALFARTLMTLDQIAIQRGFKRICILINSGGGEVETGMSIYDAMLRISTPVDTYVTGRANSMAGVLFQAGRRRYMNKNASLMLHNPSGSDNEKQLEVAKKSLVKMLNRHGDMTDKKISDLMNRETWIMADEAETLGLCDEVIEIAKLNNYSYTANKNVPSKTLWAQLETTVNKLNEKTHTMKNKEIIAASLGLAENSSEKEINAAADELGMVIVDGVLNKKSKKKPAKDDDGEEEDTVNNAVLDALNKVNARLDNMEKADKEKSKNDTEVKITNKITALVKAGKITNDVATIALVKKDLSENFDIASRLYDGATAKVTVAATKVTDILANADTKLAAETTKALIDTLVKENEEGAPVLDGTITIKDGRSAFTPATPKDAKRVTFASAKAELIAKK